MNFHLVLRFQLKIVFYFIFCRKERFIPISSNGVYPRRVIWHRNRKCVRGKRAGELRKGHCDHRQLSPRRSRSVIGDECTSIATSRVFPSPSGKAREVAIWVHKRFFNYFLYKKSCKKLKHHELIFSCRKSLLWHCNLLLNWYKKTMIYILLLVIFM